jgi:hypothetical protein
MTFSESVFYAGASLTRSRASVNLLNDAPAWRRMVVSEEDRTIVVPFENRTMVVR